MKQTLILLCAGLFLSSCIQKEPLSQVLPNNDYSLINPVTKSQLQKRLSSVIDNSDSFVSMVDVLSYLNTEGVSIEPFCGDNSDTLMYVVNFPNGTGWKIISADKRTPAVLAEGPSGSFSSTIHETGIANWLDLLAKNMSVIRKSKDESLSFSKKDIVLNRSCWTKQPQIEIDSTLTSGFRSPGFPEGHWEISTTSEREPYDSITSMVGHWDQDEPYNLYCPLKSDGTGNRAPAGCVAIAGAQLLHYLYTQYEMPQSFVSTGYCSGDVISYIQSFSGSSTTILSSVDTAYHESSSYNGAECLLIGYVGFLVNMHYRDGYSWALPDNLITNVFELFGYSCQSGQYDESIVRSNLLSGLPVIMVATNLLIPADFDIHAFVIDGYKRTRIKYTHYHYWVPDGSLDPGSGFGPGGDVPFEPIDNYYTYSYSSPEITGVHINWGWWTQWYGNPRYNNGWYTLTDDWLVNNGGNLITYNHNRHMIYGFSVDN